MKPPGDEGADVGHDHVRQEGAELLDVNPGRGALRARSRGAGHAIPFGVIRLTEDL